MAWWSWLVKPAQMHEPDCKAKAIYACFVYGKTQYVRVVVGMTPDTKQWHCQAQAKIDGVWKYLGVDDKMRIREGLSDTFLPSKYWKPEALLTFIKQSVEVDSV